MSEINNGQSETRVIEAGPPLWLLAEITYACPLHCAYCSNPLNLTDKKDEIGTEDWLRVLSEARLSGGAAKRESQGADGGQHGSNAYVIVNPSTDREQRYPGIVSNVGLHPGDVYRIETAGGGGVNPPRQRDPKRVAEDVLDGYITLETAREVYGMTEA